jgi:hypothetical protein
MTDLPLSLIALLEDAKTLVEAGMQRDALHAISAALAAARHPTPDRLHDLNAAFEAWITKQKMPSDIPLAYAAFTAAWEPAPSKDSDHIGDSTQMVGSEISENPSRPDIRQSVVSETPEQPVQNTVTDTGRLPPCWTEPQGQPDDLLPCPFCGESRLKERRFRDADDGHVEYGFYCLHCGGAALTMMAGEEARHRWNARPSPEREAVDLEEAVRALWNDQESREWGLGEYDAFKSKYPNDSRAHADYLWKVAELCAKAWKLDVRPKP